MAPVLIVGLAGMFGGLLVSRHMSERALGLLTPEQKLALIDAFSQHRKYGALPLVAVAFMFVGLRFVPDDYVRPGLCGIAAFFAACLIWQSRAIVRKLKKLGMPESFIGMLRRAQWYSRAGWLVFLVAMLIGLRK